MKIKNFQGLRGWAIILIIISHFYSRYNYWGALGVSIFMCLSGYFSVYTYKENILYDFKWLIRKIIKFYPLYLMITLITSYYFNTKIVYGVDERTNIVALLTNIFMVQTHSKKEIYWGAFSQVGWYMPFVVLTIIMTPLFTEVWKRLSRYTALVTMGICFFTNFIFSLWFLQNNGASAHYFLYLFPIFRLLDFMGGGCVAILVREKEKHKNINKKLIFLCLIDIVLIVYLIFLSTKINSILFFNLIWMLPVWVLVFCIGRIDGLSIIKIFENEIIVFIGEISLELMLCHLCVKYCCENLFINMQIKSIRCFVVFVIIILVSYSVSLINRKVYSFIVKLL